MRPLPTLISQIGPAFCIPANEQFLGYWDRVEDRLYKIRHCMNISGLRRDLALFAPEIDPMLLVRAKAAGLSLEDVLDAIAGELPPYRFLYLIERAKSYAATLQGFGAALLSALEKKDVEELNLLRTVHQKNILGMTSRVREDEYAAALEGVQALEKRREAVENRRDYYGRLQSDGLIPKEQAQVDKRRTAKIMRGTAFGLDILASTGFLIPQVGSPFALTFGGMQLGDSSMSWAQYFRTLAAEADSDAAMAGLQAGFTRREQGWIHQVELADDEIAEIEKQRKIAEIRQDIAERSLAIHGEMIEQADAIWELYSAKFTNLGLYTWLSQELQKLFRQAYGNAYAMAKLAERAYRFERGDETGPWLASNYWEASRAGLLAGERLLLDLQNLERRFIETNYRSLEIDQAFSLTQVAPAALLCLKAQGECTFEIPELYFDLFYPGHYKRRIKAVRLTIPCVTGPYTNVSASLELLESKIRSRPELGAAHLKLVPRSRSISIATSTAQNDAGVFELSFRDERYMPFEGAGAASRWKLSLPKSFRPFDYQTINDVILHISYTAEYDEGLRDEAEGVAESNEHALITWLRDHALRRVFSLRQEFSSGFNRLLHTPTGGPVPIELMDKHFPIFLKGKELTVETAVLVLATAGDQSVGDFQISIDGAPQTGFSDDERFGGLPSVDLGSLFTGGILGEHTFVIDEAGGLAPDSPPPSDTSAIDSEKLVDILLYLEYRLGT